MKKLLMICAAAAMMLGIASCNNNKNEEEGTGLFESNGFRDSVSQLAGKAYGMQNNMQLNYYLSNLPDSDRNSFNKEEFIRGMVRALKTDTTSESYITGYMQGTQMLQFILQQNRTVPIDVDAFIVAFSNEFLKDTIGADEMSKVAGEFQFMLNRIQEEQMRRRDIERQKDPVAVANKNAGLKAIADAKAANPNLKTTESGLVYEIIEPGEGDHVPYNAQAQVIYTGKFTDGKVFDSSNGEPVSFNVQGVVKGFSEGLQMLGKGGKALLYIPGDLAYGINGMPQAGIGPNTTLVFEVEVVDFTDPSIANL